MAAQAIPSYAPHQAAASHFNKLECFCFKQYTLRARRVQALAGGVRDRPEAAEGRRRPSPCRTPSSRSAARRRRRRRRPRHGRGPDERAVMARPACASRLRRAAAAISADRQGRAWSFFGIRKSREYASDLGESNPLHVSSPVVAALLLSVVLVTAGQVGAVAAASRPQQMVRQGPQEFRIRMEYMSAATHKGTHALLLRAAQPSRHPACAAVRHAADHLSARSRLDQRRRLGHLLLRARASLRLDLRCSSSGSATRSARARAASTASASTSRSAGA